MLFLDQMESWAVWIERHDGTRYGRHKLRATTLVGVAQIFVDVAKQGGRVVAWERITIHRPTEKEREALLAFLRLADVDIRIP